MKQRSILPFKRDKQLSKARGPFFRVGGPVDRFAVSLNLYGEDLDADEVTRLLGQAPTESGRKGSRRRPGVAPRRKGVWSLSSEAEAPVSPAEALEILLSAVPSDPALWADLSRRFEVTVSFGVFLAAWNRSFDLPSSVLTRVTRLGASRS